MSPHTLQGPHQRARSDGRRRRVLVIDDDREIVQGLRTRLEFAGFDVEAAYDGLHGLDAAKASPPDAVLLDIRMPKMDGLAVLRELRLCQATRETPVIMLSASLRDQCTALDEGARFFVQKPYEARAILAALQAAVGN
jgi:DNA-binding response OmpR family regulator